MTGPGLPSVARITTGNTVAAVGRTMAVVRAAADMAMTGLTATVMAALVTTMTGLVTTMTGLITTMTGLVTTMAPLAMPMTTVRVAASLPMAGRRTDPVGPMSARVPVTPAALRVAGGGPIASLPGTGDQARKIGAVPAIARPIRAPVGRARLTAAAGKAPIARNEAAAQMVATAPAVVGPVPPTTGRKETGLAVSMTAAGRAVAAARKRPTATGRGATETLHTASLVWTRCGWMSPTALLLTSWTRKPWPSCGRYRPTWPA